MRYLLIFFFWATPLMAQTVKDPFANFDDNLDAIFERVAEEIGVPQPLLRAICWSESKFNREGYNPGDGKGNNHAFGICQVLHSTARGLGFKDDKCFGDFDDKVDAKTGRLRKAIRSYRTCKLFGAYTNILYAAKYLKTKMDQYDNSYISAIAAYNAGSVRICKTGYVLRAKDRSILWKCTPGKILNEFYINGVLKALEEGR